MIIITDSSGSFDVSQVWWFDPYPWTLRDEQDLNFELDHSSNDEWLEYDELLVQAIA